MASLKDDGPPNILDDLTPVAARGRNAYSRFNVVRTKPGRGDAPPTNAMSCSDKIALWCAVGIQGALLSSMGMTPLYIKSITISGVKGTQILEDMENEIQDDCRRAFSGRLHKPGISNMVRLVDPWHILNCFVQILRCIPPTSYSLPVNIRRGGIVGAGKVDPQMNLFVGYPTSAKRFSPMESDEV